MTKRLTILGSLLVFLTFWAMCQTPMVPRKSPKEVVEEFWKLETEGGRLTSEGWNKANSFFVKPSPPPKEKLICVIENDFSVWNPVINGDTAEVTVGVGDILKIDPEMRASQLSASLKSGIISKLILTDKHWELGSDGKGIKEVTGPSEWRFEDNGNTIWLNVETAIRYVKQTRDKTTNPLIKRNASRTLAVLQHRVR